MTSKIIDSQTELALSEIELALELWQLTERMRTDDKRASTLKKYFKKRFPEDCRIEFGSVSILLESCERTGLDKAQLEIALGEDKLAEFTKITKYRTIKVRKDKEGETA